MSESKQLVELCTNLIKQHAPNASIILPILQSRHDMIADSVGTFLITCRHAILEKKTQPILDYDFSEEIKDWAGQLSKIPLIVDLLNSFTTGARKILAEHLQTKPDETFATLQKMLQLYAAYKLNKGK